MFTTAALIALLGYWGRDDTDDGDGIIALIAVAFLIAGINR